ncbi:hypothetical protein ACFP81_05400 [Deinococcus lacus]|uniref:AI-2E family transporter n=1 Tax=Deinococcus lacus TaxID=392561 RepID=A0ABW1YDL5_9DEIO
MTRQEQRWKRVRVLEFGITALLILAFIVLNSRWMTLPIFAVFLAVFGG